MADYKKNDKKNENGDNTQDSGEEINKSLPDTREGDIHDLVQLIPSIETTTPPSPFTEATLLGAMENISRYVTDPDDKKILKETDGLGTPATRADIISNAIARSYLYYEGKHILPTEKGTSMIHALPKAIKDVGVTARWEKGLEMIASGSMNYERFMEHISSWIINIINER
jgi:DNA topoisomerase-3